MVISVDNSCKLQAESWEVRVSDLVSQVSSAKDFIVKVNEQDYSCLREDKKFTAD